MNSEYSYKTLIARKYQLIAAQQTAIDKVQAALNDVDIDLMLKMRLIDTIYATYKNELEAIEQMITVAEWYETRKEASE